MPENTPYSRWFYTAKDPETEMPWATTLLYRACDNDSAKFEAAERVMQAAFEAGAGDRYDEAKALVVGSEKASASWVQRKLHIGYNEASKYIERMEAEGFISTANSVGRRDVLASDLRRTGQ